jgi:hypothetical protein
MFKTNKPNIIENTKNKTEKENHNKNIQDNYNDNDNDNDYDNDNFNPIIKNSLEYYDSFQPKIQEILNKIEYIKIINGVNINDEYIFYEKNDKPFFKSRIEILGMFVPQDNSWKWSWSIPFAKFHNTLISRKILEYAFTLNSLNDLYLKSTLINSKLLIKNQYQIDIYIALASMLSKKPFIIRLYLYPNINENVTEEIYYYKDIINKPDKDKFISIYVMVIDWDN